MAELSIFENNLELVRDISGSTKNGEVSGCSSLDFWNNGQSSKRARTAVSTCRIAFSGQKKSLSHEKARLEMKRSGK